MRIKTLFTGFCCGILLAPAMAFAADSAPAPKAKQTVADTPFVIVGCCRTNGSPPSPVREVTARCGRLGGYFFLLPAVPLGFHQSEDYVNHSDD